MSSTIEGLAALANRALQHGATYVDGANAIEWDVNAYCENPFNRTLHARGYDRELRKHKWATRPGSLSVHLTGLPCRKCRKCLYIRANGWRERIAEEFTRHERTWFVTLTFNPFWQQKLFMEEMALKNSSGWLDSDFDTKEAEWRLRAMGASRLLTKWLKRVRKPLAGEEAVGLRYVAVTERHKTGLPHLHLLMHEEFGKLTYRRIVDRWTRYGFADASLVRDRLKTGWYVAKYVTKDSLTRMRASEKYGRLPSKVPSDLIELYDALSLLAEQSAEAARNNPTGGGPLSFGLAPATWPE